MNYKATPEGIEVIKKSPFSSKDNTMIFEVTLEKFEKSLYQWKNGSMIQNAFPYLDADEREFLLTGSTSDDWQKIFGAEED